MDIKLDASRESLAQKLFMCFYLEKGCLSARWKIMSLIRTPVIGFLFLLINIFLNRGFQDFMWIYFAMVCLLSYAIDITTSRIYRKKIIADMNNTTAIEYDAPDNDGKGENGIYKTWVMTMMGTLTFISSYKISQRINLKKGALYNYFSYPEIKGLNKGDLRYYISGCITKVR